MKPVQKTVSPTLRGVVAVLLGASMLAAGCVTPADHRKLKYKVAEIQRGGGGRATGVGDADLAAQIPEVVEWIRELQGEWLDGVNPVEVAQGLRPVRKQLSEAVFDVRELQASEVATRHTAKAVYTGVILDDPGKLLSWWRRTVGSPLHSKVLAHHMTIKFRPSDDEVAALPVGRRPALPAP